MLLLQLIVVSIAQCNEIVQYIDTAGFFLTLSTDMIGDMTRAFFFQVNSIQNLGRKWSHRFALKLTCDHSPFFDYLNQECHFIVT